MENELSIIDSHAHLDYPQFEGKIDEVLSRAKELGVTEVISIGVKLSAVDGPRRSKSVRGRADATEGTFR